MPPSTAALQGRSPLSGLSLDEPAGIFSQFDCVDETLAELRDGAVSARGCVTVVTVHGEQPQYTYLLTCPTSKAAHNPGKRLLRMFLRRPVGARFTFEVTREYHQEDPEEAVTYDPQHLNSSNFTTSQRRASSPDAWPYRTPQQCTAVDDTWRRLPLPRDVLDSQ